MQRRALYVATLASVLNSFSCSSDSSSPRGADGSSGQGTGGNASSAGSAGVSNLSGGSSGGQSQPGAGSTSGGTTSATGGTTSTGGTSSTAGTAGTGMAGSGGGPVKQTGTAFVYTGGFGSFPLRAYTLDKTSGALTQVGGDEDGGQSPSYLALHPAGTYLYNANEDDGSSAGVTAHHIKADGSLERLNHQQGSKKCGNGSCGFTYVAVDPAGKAVFAADYDGGSVSVFPINQDGSLGAEKQMLDFGGKAEAHCVAFDPAGKFAFVPTLGLDQVQQLKLGADGMLSANSPANVMGAQNAGPRHISVHPSGKLAFLINETASTMTPYAVSADGKLTAGTTVPTVPQGTNGEFYGQHVKISPDGRFLYGSNVGMDHNSIVVYSVDQGSGALTWLQDQSSGGMWPRDFDVDPNGEVLIAANRDSNNLAVFKIGADGKLSPLGQPTKVSDQPSAVVIRYQK